MHRSIAACAILAAPVCAAGCSGEPEGVSEEEGTETEFSTRSQSLETAHFPATAARQWMTNLTLSVKFDTISPPVAARTYTYGAIALYESVVHGMPGHQSLVGQLNGLDSLPLPDPALDYDWPTVLAQTMHTFIDSGIYVYPNRLFYEYTTPVQAALTTLGPAQVGFRRASGVPEEVMEDSIAFGNELGAALAEWANADGYYEARYKSWIPPTGPDKWVPTGFQDLDKVVSPLEPHFGSLRTLVLTEAAECAGPPPVPFSTEPGSEFYDEANAVYQADVNLTDLQWEIAQFWADDPGLTPTPPGHWVGIATKLLKDRSLDEAVAGYVYTSLGYYDAFVAIWRDKYLYNLIRPETYIRRHIDPGWRPTVRTPPFPSYLSGHSGQSGTAGVLFTEFFGDIPFVDDTKLRRGFSAFHYDSFTEAADEAAASRLYGGIHYPMDNVQSQGFCVAERIKERVHLEL